MLSLLDELYIKRSKNGLKKCICKEKLLKKLTRQLELQCRLQRMERRLALLKQKEEMAGSPHIVTSPPPKPGTMSYTEPIFSPPEKTPHKKKSGGVIVSTSKPGSC